MGTFCFRDSGELSNRGICSYAWSLIMWSRLSREIEKISTPCWRVLSRKPLPEIILMLTVSGFLAFGLVGTSRGDGAEAAGSLRGGSVRRPYVGDPSASAVPRSPWASFLACTQAEVGGCDCGAIFNPAAGLNVGAVVNSWDLPLALSQPRFVGFSLLATTKQGHVSGAECARCPGVSCRCGQ